MNSITKLTSVEAWRELSTVYGLIEPISNNDPDANRGCRNAWTIRPAEPSMHVTPPIPVAETFALFAASEQILAVRWVCLCVLTRSIQRREIQRRANSVRIEIWPFFLRLWHRNFDWLTVG